MKRLTLMSATFATITALLCSTANAFEVRWTGTSGSWWDDASWSDYRAPQSRQADVVIDAVDDVNFPLGTRRSTVTLSSGSPVIRTLRLGSLSTLDVTAGSLQMEGDAVRFDGTPGLPAVSGQLNIINMPPDALLGSTTLIVAKQFALTGPGVTTLVSSNVNSSRATIFNAAAGAVLTIDGHRVQGGGVVELWNRGSTIVNAGTIAANAPVALELKAQQIDNGRGRIEVAAGSRLRYTGTLSGGTIRGELGSVLFAGRDPAYSTQIQDLSISGIRVAGPVGGSLESAGGVQLGDVAADGHGDARLAKDALIHGQGSRTVMAAFEANGHTLTVARGHTLEWRDGYFRDSTFGAGLGITNLGTIAATGGRFSLYSPSRVLDNAAGAITLARTALLDVTGTIAGGRISGESGARISGGVFRDLSLAGSITTAALRPGSGNQAVRLSGRITVEGRFSWIGECLGPLDVNCAGAWVDLAGDTELAGFGQTFLSTAALGLADTAVAGNGHTLTIGAGHTLYGNSFALGQHDLDVINRGELIADGGQLRVRAVTIDSTEGRLGATATGQLVLDGQVMLGNQSMMSVQAGMASVVPASRAFQPEAVLPSGGVNFLRSVKLDGTLVFDLSEGQLGQTFEPLSFSAGYTGVFDQIVSNGYELAASYLPGKLSLTVTAISAVPESGSLLYLLLGLPLLIHRAARKAGGRADHQRRASQRQHRLMTAADMPRREQGRAGFVAAGQRSGAGRRAGVRH